MQGEELEPQKNVDLRTRLANKLFAKQKKKLDEVLNIKVNFLSSSILLPSLVL